MKKIVYIIATLLLSFGFYACDDVNSLHDTYLQEGERLYVGKPDSFAIFGGDKRAKLVVWTKDQRVSFLTVERVDTTLKYDFVYDLVNRPDSMVFYLDDLKEGSNVLSWKNWNIDKTISSIVQGTSVTVWGDRFRSFLTYRKAVGIANNTILKWHVEWASVNAKEPIMGTYAIGHEVKYKTVSNNDTIVQTIYNPESLSSPALKTTMPKYSTANTNVEYRMLFKPAVTSVDTFKTEFKSLN